MYDVIDKEHLERVVAHLPKKHATLVTQATKDARELTPVYTANEVCVALPHSYYTLLANNHLRSCCIPVCCDSVNHSINEIHCRVMCVVQVLARAVRSAAYSTAVTLLRATQAKASLYAPAFKGGKG